VALCDLVLTKGTSPKRPTKLGDQHKRGVVTERGAYFSLLKKESKARAVLGHRGGKRKKKTMGSAGTPASILSTERLRKGKGGGDETVEGKRS